MTHWLYPANTKFYDVIGAFNEAEAYWPVNSKVMVGDIVYIYLAAPYKQIGFICDVTEIDIEEDKIIDNVRPFFKKPPDTNRQLKSFMKLQNISNFTLKSDSMLAYNSLKKNGLKGMLMGPRKLDNNPTLLDYIKRNL